LNWWIVLK